jgi:hypothetical protein
VNELVVLVTEGDQLLDLAILALGLLLLLLILFLLHSDLVQILLDALPEILLRQKNFFLGFVNLLV